ncbi:MAG: sodium:proton antiporter [Acidimicrobiaceae bacterium]|jgi:ATP-binding protein involved in chromosome partitioning|nr:sodium:proton antiporter [Acidimicrobiaceae bacterium]|tara:strand:+ start:74773 stop:75939 length:1167 start_codon:yes stop_codon:yes gene_type:complete
MDDNNSDLGIKEKVMNQLRGVIDPELGSDIVDLGMVKEVDFRDSGELQITIALTTAGCPLKAQIQKDIRGRMKSISEVKHVKVNWTELSDEERAQTMDRARFNLSKEDVVTQIPPTTKSIMIASGKGGVGKSSVTANIATGLAARGLTVGVLDADIWGFSIPQMLGVEGRLAGNEETKRIVPLVKNIGSGTLKIISMGFLVDENKSSLNWRGLILNRAVRHFLEDVEWGEMDYLIIDMPPGTGDVQMGLAKMLPRSDMIVVTTPSKTVQTVATRVASMAQSYYLRIAGVVENMSAFINEDGKEYNIFGSGGGEELAQELGVPLLGSIPIDPFVSNGSDTGVPVILGDGHAARALNSIVDEVISAVPRINPLDCTAHGSLETSVSITNS